jgi:predicted PurR-regulated permease PerM
MTDRLIRQRAFFFGMVLILALLALLLVWQFTRAILFALAMVVILKPLYNWTLKKRWINGNAGRATAATMIMFILIIAIPIGLIIFGAISQAGRLFEGLNLEGMDFSVRGIVAAIENLFKGIGAGNLRLDGLQISETVMKAVAGISAWARGVLINLGRSLPRIFTNTMVALVLIYVLLPRYKSPGKQDILEIVPFAPEITQLFLDKFDLMIKAMFRGTFVIAIVQGLAMGLVLLIAGVPFVLFLTLLSMLLSLVPLIGVSLIAWPIGIILLLTGQVWQGIFVIAAFLLVIANLDTVLRPYLIPKGAQLNPALIILSVFGGLSLLGIIGAIYGPVIMILLVTSIDVYTKYILRSDLETLDKQGRLDLKELGLVPQEGEAGQNVGQMFVSVLKNVTAPFRRESTAKAADEPEPNATEEDLG